MENHLRPDDHSISSEPALGNHSREASDEDRAHHGIGDESILRHVAPESVSRALNFSDWYQQNALRTSWSKSWLVTFGLMAAGGLFAVLGAFMQTQSTSAVGIMVIAIIGPAVEEMLKISPALILIERYPYLFKSAFQPWMVVLSTALAFAVLENLIYLNVYIENPSTRLRAWRWTICTALHVSASTVAGWGLYRMYRQTKREHERADLQTGFPFFISAAIVHGLYNFTMVFVGTLYFADE